MCKSNNQLTLLKKLAFLDSLNNFLILGFFLYTPLDLLLRIKTLTSTYVKKVNQFSNYPQLNHLHSIHLAYTCISDCVLQLIFFICSY